MIVSKEKMTGFFPFQIFFHLSHLSQTQPLAWSNSQGAAEKGKDSPTVFNVRAHRHALRGSTQPARGLLQAGPGPDLL